MTTPARRTVLLGAVAAVPAAALGAGCGGTSEKDRRARLTALMEAHVKEENHHDLEGVMATFSEPTELVMNGVTFAEPAALRQGHIDFGMSAQMGGLTGTEVVPQRLYFPDGEPVVLVEGEVRGKHVGPVAGFPGTGQQVALPYLGFYRFDGDDKLVSERIVMNWAPLAQG